MSELEKFKQSVYSGEISDMKGYEQLPKNIKGNLIKVSGQISNIVNQIK
jgi:hypothetical protein